MKKRLFVIDGHALCYRAYYAFIKNPLINSAGQNISAIFGFARMLLKLIQDQNPDYMIVAFDPPKKSFRFKLYPEYKANREKMPDDLRSQIEEIKNMVSIIGLKTIVPDDYEADDVLGTIAKKYGSKDLGVVLVTGDKDAYQLVDKNVTIYANTKGITEHIIYDTKAIKEKKGIMPEQIIDFMALTGDSSDNIPGVRGIGEKTALKLISEYKSLDGIYDNIEAIKGKMKSTLIEDREMALLSKDLVTIRTDLPVEFNVAETNIPELHTEPVREYFIRLEMQSIVKNLFGDDDNSRNETEKLKEQRDYRIIRTIEELEAALKKITRAGTVSVDTETTSKSPIEAELVGISMSIAENQGWYIPVRSEELFSDVILDPGTALTALKPMLEDPDIKKIGQNIKYDTIVLNNAGIGLRGICFDTMVASYLLDPSSRRHNMDDLAQTHLNYTTTSFSEIVGKGKKAIPITAVPLDTLSDYAIEDSDITYRLYTLFKNKLKEEKLEKLFTDMEIPLIPVLVSMEQNGVKIDTGHFERLARKNEKMLSGVEEEIYTLAGRTFNINSTRELSEILFNELSLKTQRKTKTGYSTDIKVLEALRGDHEIIEHLISYRTLNKLKTTYIDTLPLLISQRTGRIHTSYNQTVAATGRLSSSDPNLQNIPIKDEFGRTIRQGFIADEGCLLLSADYSQVELRLAAHISKDEQMCNAFQLGTDIHSLTASSVFGIDIESVTRDMRRQAKIINFATIYGVSPFGLSQQAEISIQDAAEFIKRYFETYPGFRDYVDTTISFARKNGYVETLLGRKRPVPNINATAVFQKEGAERIAINTPIQGTSADLIKIAMINIHREMEKQQLRAKMTLQVHDELVFEVPEGEKDTMETLVRKEMENALELSIPLVVDMHWGKNWDEAH